MNHPAIAIATIEVSGHHISPVSQTRLSDLATATELPIATEDKLPDLMFYLYWRDHQLTVRDQSNKKAVEISIDFCSGKNRHRLQFGGGYGQPLARAVNAKPNTPQTICDATGGLGQDAFVFASLGCNVVLVEQSKIVAALLNDALQRALANVEFEAIAKRMQLYQFDSCQLPKRWPLKELPSTVYLDPMYPQSGKSAAAKKGMSTLQRMLPIEQSLTTSNTVSLDDETSLLQAAMATATQRVVVKRPAKAPPLAASSPVGSVRSPNTRYDLYKPQPGLDHSPGDK